MDRIAGNRKGFSSIELMVVLAIAAILMGFGVHSFRTLLQGHRMSAAVSEFYAAINLARAEAIHRGTRVDLMPADGIDWGKGWVVFVDSNGSHKADESDDILFRSMPAPAKMSIHSSFTDSSVPYIAYTGSGRTRTNANAQQPQLGNITFVLEDRTKKIKLNFQGRPRVCDPVTEPSTC
jgi:type IV fimbrial biogenesis protein FimT